MLFVLVSVPTLADIGKVVKVVGGTDAFLVRNQERLKLTPNLALEVGDHLVSSNTYTVILIYPASQMSLPKKSQLKITKAVVESNDDGSVKAASNVNLLKGLVRVQVTKQPDQQIDQKVSSKNVTFGVRGTEFEVAMDDEGVDLDVLSGAVDVRSSLGNFVPKLVGANEAFRFSPNLKELIKKNFAPRFNDHPGFLEKEELQGWFKNKLTDKIDEKVKIDDKIEEKIEENLKPDIKGKLKGLFDR